MCKHIFQNYYFFKKIRNNEKSTNKGGSAIKDAFRSNKQEELSEIQQGFKAIEQQKKTLQNELAALQQKDASDKERSESETKVQEIKVKAEKEAKDVRDLQQQIEELSASMSKNTSASSGHEVILSTELP